jgi:hypothetical protein
MIRLIGFLVFIFVRNAVGSESFCNKAGLGQAYPPKDISGGVVCFVYTRTDEQYDGDFSKSPDGISVFFFRKSEGAKLVYEFPYAGTRGKINDAFFIPVGKKYGEVLFVIHSIETPRSWDPVSDVYDVSVIRFQGEVPILDKRLSRFFDMGGDFVDAQGQPTYFYPYKDRTAVEAAVRSPLFDVVRTSSSVEGVVREKSFLYRGDSEPSFKTGMYLIKGDKVKVEDSTGGRCKVTYAAKLKSITMWIDCKSIFF